MAFLRRPDYRASLSDMNCTPLRHLPGGLTEGFRLKLLLMSRPTNSTLHIHSSRTTAHRISVQDVSYSFYAYDSPDPARMFVHDKLSAVGVEMCMCVCTAFDDLPTPLTWSANVSRTSGLRSFFLCFAKPQFVRIRVSWS